MDIHLADPVDVADVSGRPDLRRFEHAEVAAVAIFSRAIRARPFSIFRIDFGNVDVIQRVAAVPICAALNGIVHTEWDKFFVLQDFDIGAIYTPAMIKEEKQAVYDQEAYGWILWNSLNQYTREALEKN